MENWGGWVKLLNKLVPIFLCFLAVVSCSKSQYDSNWKNKKIAERAIYNCEDIAYMLPSKVNSNDLPATFKEFEALFSQGELVGGIFRDEKGQALFDYNLKEDTFVISKKVYKHDNRSYKVGINKQWEVVQIAITP